MKKNKIRCKVYQSMSNETEIKIYMTDNYLGDNEIHLITITLNICIISKLELWDLKVRKKLSLNRLPNLANAKRKIQRNHSLPGRY